MAYLGHFTLSQFSLSTAVVMALFKKASCLAFLLWAIYYAPAESHRQEQPVSAHAGEECRTCHQAIFDSFVKTAHFNTSARAGAATIIGNGEGAISAFSAGRNMLRTRTGVYFKMERRGPDFYQTASDATIGRSRTERFDIVIGSGRKGQSYLYWRDGLLFQLPVSYLRGIEEWINSPGYPDGQINFA
ncbi:MAG: hypothetical protein J2P41_16665, partial [Blastocatellia bacterium]|nr:hypothetical protein [Blastocatellia bacterium]